MNRRIKKRLGSICKALLTVPVSYARSGLLLSSRSVGALKPVGRTVSEVPFMIVRSTYRSTAILVVKRPQLRKHSSLAVNAMQAQIQLVQAQVLNALKEKAAQGHRATVKAATIVVKVIGTFPCASTPVQPAIYKELLSHSNNLVNESVSETSSGATASVASSVCSESGAETFVRPSTVGHGLTVQLARDDLDSILAA